VGGVSVGSGAILEGGDGSAAAGALTFAGNVSLLSGSDIELTLGPSATHSSLVRTGGTWSFDSTQAFLFNIALGASGSTTYDDLITGLTGTETGLASDGNGIISNWQIATPGVTGTFTYDGMGDVNLTLVTIPESGAAALLLAGLPLLALRRRRRVERFQFNWAHRWERQRRKACHPERSRRTSHIRLSSPARRRKSATKIG